MTSVLSFMHAMVRASYPLPPESSTQTSTTASRPHFFFSSQFLPSSTEPTPPPKTFQEDTKPLDLETTPSVIDYLPSPLSALPTTTTTTIIVFGKENLFEEMQSRVACSVTAPFLVALSEGLALRGRGGGICLGVLGGVVIVFASSPYPLPSPFSLLLSPLISTLLPLSYLNLPPLPTPTPPKLTPKNSFHLHPPRIKPKSRPRGFRLSGALRDG